MKKICFVIPRAYFLFNPDIKGVEDKIGGAQTQSFLLAKAINELNSFDISFIVADFGQKKTENYDGIKVLKSFRFSDNKIIAAYKLFKAIRYNNSDFYIFRSPDAGIGIAVWFIRNILKKKTIYMIASNFEIIEDYKKKYMSVTSRLLMKYVYKRSDIVTTQTYFQYVKLHEAFGRKANAIIRNLIKIPVKQCGTCVRKHIIWVGRLAKVKNPELFLELADKYPDYSFVMVAPIYFDEYKYGQNILKQIKSHKNIIFYDTLSYDKIIELYKNSKIYVLTSDVEGFSNTMLEALTYGAAVITYGINPDNIFFEYEIGIATKKDKKNFFEEFDKILKDDFLRKKLTNNAFKYVQKFHDKNVIIKDFIKLFD